MTRDAHKSFGSRESTPIPIVAERVKTRAVMVGGVAVGGGAPITVQSMTTTKTGDVKSTVEQIAALASVGCDIVRVAVPDMESARAVRDIKRRVKIPVVADIHFDHNLALEAIASGADKIRVNPGNIGDRGGLLALAKAAMSRKIPIRIGVNGGSLERSIQEKYGGATPEAMAESALSQAAILEDFGFSDIVLSIKSTNVFAAVEACRIVARSGADYPQHIGMTEAGASAVGASRNAIGISALLREGIGDTLRVSLTGDPLDEVAVGIDILRAHGIMRGGVRVISCPTCGRCEINLAEIADAVERRTRTIKSEKTITVAVMGCVVNGPGEAKNADMGIAGGKGRAALFVGGKVIGSAPEGEAAAALIAEVERAATQL